MSGGWKTVAIEVGVHADLVRLQVERQAATGTRISLSDVVWYLLETRKEYLEIVESERNRS